MATFITQGRFTQEAFQTMLAHPSDRSKEVEKLFAAVGGKLLAYYMTFGDTDFLVISEGPADGVYASSLAAAATAGVSELKTFLAIPSSEMVDALSRAGSIASAFRGPTQPG